MEDGGVRENVGRSGSRFGVIVMVVGWWFREIDWVEEGEE